MRVLDSSGAAVALSNGGVPRVAIPGPDHYFVIVDEEPGTYKLLMRLY